MGIEVSRQLTARRIEVSEMKWTVACPPSNKVGYSKLIVLRSLLGTRTATIKLTHSRNNVTLRKTTRQLTSIREGHKTTATSNSPTVGRIRTTTLMRATGCPTRILRNYRLRRHISVSLLIIRLFFLENPQRSFNPESLPVAKNAKKKNKFKKSKGEHKTQQMIS